ncbi:MAG: FAD-dependent oxidoreductase [Nanoarchaeota archaeon]|nr:FAD-dependent oxidoreductase [Nanoarchaeota archaeon]MBU4283916.1 FAD-dependent oxidoreductase [Nanoarchaeota archaeon]MBU4493535.1 FAD-dependent oxidoreductase [Nanoarchaeota archaeon]MCG2719761.1 FAD-dependent oxidoreductase [Nanoarchaeota archaeon]
MAYDLIIIGAGPAGLSAAIYASKYKLNTLVIGEELGGTATHAYKVENYPGFRSIPGIELMNKFKEQVKGLAGIKNEEIIKLEKKGNFIITTRKGTYQSNALIFAAGTKRKALNIKGENEFLNKGVSYCATCDAAFFKDKVVGVVGGNDAAAMSALLLAEYAKKVFIIYRKEKIRAEPLRVRQLEKSKKITIINNTNVIAVNGDKMMSSVTLDREFNHSKELNLSGLFIEIGSIPSTVLTEKLGIKLDEEGYIIVDPAQKTNVDGFYAAGDITTGSNKFGQIITAASEGAVAAHSVYGFLKNKS